MTGHFTCAVCCRTSSCGNVRVVTRRLTVVRLAAIRNDHGAEEDALWGKLAMGSGMHLEEIVAGCIAAGTQAPSSPFKAGRSIDRVSVQHCLDCSI